MLKLLLGNIIWKMNEKWSALWLLEAILLYCTSTPFKKLLSGYVFFLEVVASKGIAVSSENWLTERLFVGVPHTSSWIDGGGEVLVSRLFESSLENDGFLFWFILAVVEGFDGGSVISYSFSFLHFVDKVLAESVLNLSGDNLMRLYFWYLVIDAIDIFLTENVSGRVAVSVVENLAV